MIFNVKYFFNNSDVKCIVHLNEVGETEKSFLEFKNNIPSILLEHGFVERIEKTKMFVPGRPLLVDNAAMIAYTGEIMFKAKANVFKHTELDKVDINPRERTDDVEVSWKK